MKNRWLCRNQSLSCIHHLAQFLLPWWVYFRKCLSLHTQLIAPYQGFSCGLISLLTINRWREGEFSLKPSVLPQTQRKLPDSIIDFSPPHLFHLLLSLLAATFLLTIDNVMIFILFLSFFSRGDVLRRENLIPLKERK